MSKDIIKIRLGEYLLQNHIKLNTFFREFHKSPALLFTWTEKNEKSTQVTASFLNKQKTINHYSELYDKHSTNPQHNHDFEKGICQANAEIAGVQTVHGDITIDQKTKEAYQHFGANQQQAKTQKEAETLATKAYNCWATEILSKITHAKEKKAQFYTFDGKIALGVKLDTEHFVTYIAPIGVNLNDMLDLLPEEITIQPKPDLNWMKHLFGYEEY